MEKKETKKISGTTMISIARRNFLKKIIKRSLAVLAVAGAAGTISYKKPTIKSFFGAKKAYAQVTGPGKFTLKGSTQASSTTEILGTSSSERSKN